MRSDSRLFEAIRDALTHLHEQAKLFQDYRRKRREKWKAAAVQLVRPTDSQMTAFSDCYVVSESRLELARTNCCRKAGAAAKRPFFPRHRLLIPASPGWEEKSMTKKKPLLSLGIVVVALMLVAVDAHGQVAWWHAEGNANDSVGGANGFLEGVSFAPGKVGRAFQFNGSTSSVRVPDTPSLDITNNWTLAAWVYTTSLSGHKGGAQGVVSKVGGGGGNYGYQFGILDGTGEVYLAFNEAGQGWPGPLLRAGRVPLNTWTFIAGSYDNNTMAIYVYDVLAGSKTVGPKSVANSSSNFRIGLDDNGNGDFSGMIDEVRVYNRALSADEIRSLGSTDTNFAGRWNVNADGFTFVLDLEQANGVVRGRMTPTAPMPPGSPPSTVEGSARGREIVFRRITPGELTQEYRGYIFDVSSGHAMGGIFEHSQAWTYGWYATR